MAGASELCAADNCAAITQEPETKIKLKQRQSGIIHRTDVSYTGDIST